VRCYASSTASDPEWFQRVRNDLLSRPSHQHREDLDLTHYGQFNKTLAGFAPPTTVYRANSKTQISLAELVTRFNSRVQSSNLLGDGTDRLHHPGEPWMRRMWAGGAVNIRHGLKLGSRTGSLAPFRLQETVVCVERIKDVRLQDTGDEAKIFVTIERRFALKDVKDNESEGTLSADDSKQMVSDSDWSDSLVKEERSLVFMKAKRGSELMAVTTDQGATRYLKGTGDLSMF
jgi:hydroxyacyl-ACP dehydratase HTD2-like protein with hotdog domain